MFMKKGNLIFFSLLFGFLPFLQAKDYMVKGKVVNEKTNKEIIGVKLIFKESNKPDKYIYTSETTKDGYLITDPKISKRDEGLEYRVVAEAKGYEKYDENITLFYTKLDFYEPPALKLKPMSKAVEITGKVVSKRSGKPIAGVELIFGENKIKTNENGEYKLGVDTMFFFTPLAVNLKTNVFGYKENSLATSLELKPDDEGKFVLDILSLESDMVPVTFSGKIVDFFGGANTEGAEISIDAVGGKTGVDGMYEIEGLKIDFELSKKYKFKFSKEGYISNEAELEFSFVDNGRIKVEDLKISHVELEAPIMVKPDKLVYSLRPEFEWKLPEKHKLNIAKVILEVSDNKDFKEAISVEIDGAVEKVVFPALDQKRLNAEVNYFSRVTYSLKREQVSLPVLHEFQTAPMQHASQLVKSSPFTTGQSADLNPSWDQDGLTVYFSSNQSDTSVQIFEIWSKATDRVGQTKITNSISKCSDTFPSAGPKPGMVSFLSDRIAVNNIWAMPKNIRSPMQLTQFEDEPLRFISCSKDGKTIVYCREKKPSKVKRESNNLQIWMLNISDNSKTWLGIEGSHVKMSPDGQSILYVSDKQGSPDIWLMNIATQSNRMIVSNVNAIDTDPSWTKDGNSIVYSTNLSGNFDLWLMNVRDGIPKQLTNSLADERYSDCNPLNNEVVYCTDETDVWKLKILQLPEGY